MIMYDVIIGGASFAGLSLATKLSDCKALLIDKNKPGEYQRSACCTTLSIIKKVNCEESIMQTIKYASIHTNKEFNFKIPEPFCTIDYKKFCSIMLNRAEINFIKANIKGLKNKKIVTNKGVFSGKIIVDATGWEAVLARFMGLNLQNKLSYGLETEAPYKDDTLRIIVNNKIIKDGVGWIFPCGDKARFGVASYNGETKLLPILKRFVKNYGVKISKVHGGFFSYDKRPPVHNDLFLVGEAGGQITPLTGEGIRKSIESGLICGSIIKKILSNEISMERGINKYKKLMRTNDALRKKLIKLQMNFAEHYPTKLNIFFGAITNRILSHIFWKIYKLI